MQSHPETAPADEAAYLRAVTDLGEKREIVTTEAIYNERGLKLIDAGVRIDRRMYDRLVEHRLRQPIDRSLTVENVVTPQSLMLAMDGRLNQCPLEIRMATATSVADLLQPLAHVPLPAPITFKLTLMREQRASLYEHTLQAALISIYLGLAGGLDAQSLGRLAAAALLHDLGMLHIDSAILDTKERLTREQRLHLAAHPVTSMLIAREQGCYPATVLDAVLEHHERLDGTGYPGGRQAEQLSSLGRVLAVAELASGVFGKYAEHPIERLSVILRINHRKFAHEHAAALLHLLDDASPAEPAIGAGASELDIASVQLLGDALGQWTAAKRALQSPGLPAGSAAQFIDARLSSLHRSLQDAGYLHDQFEQLVEWIGDDPAARVELQLLAQEARWQIENTFNATRRRWPSLKESPEPADRAAAQWCGWLEQKLAGG